uniref:Apyrase n=1 Tax=Mimosa pudica TaxID=76306 RepID=O81243_MIMPU|nr:apyrase [Mimosa pudica]
MLTLHHVSDLSRNASKRKSSIDTRELKLEVTHVSHVYTVTRDGIYNTLGTLAEEVRNIDYDREFNRWEHNRKRTHPKRRFRFVFFSSWDADTNGTIDCRELLGANGDGKSSAYRAAVDGYRVICGAHWQRRDRDHNGTEDEHEYGQRRRYPDYSCTAGHDSDSNRTEYRHHRFSGISEPDGDQNYRSCLERGSERDIPCFRKAEYLRHDGDSNASSDDELGCKAYALILAENDSRSCRDGDGEVNYEEFVQVMVAKYSWSSVQSNWDADCESNYSEGGKDGSTRAQSKVQDPDRNDCEELFASSQHSLNQLSWALLHDSDYNALSSKENVL